ncbi:MAG: ferritin-like domain-containing protein [Myxococcales bacterium]|nr:ferritin-like domain-containing protein [Myxococcales bacterium]
MSGEAARKACARLDLADLGFDRGAHMLVARALSGIGVGETLDVCGRAPALGVHLRAWCRQMGHPFQTLGDDSEIGGDIVARIARGDVEIKRWAGAQRAGHPDRDRDDAVSEHPAPRWGLAARGALVEDSAPAFSFGIDHKHVVWTEEAPRLYAQAAAAQWDPATAIPWDAPFDIPDDVEDAIVQVMTYLVENETAALLVPARFLAQMHPHFREILQLLAIQAADEARHIEVFTRRALLRREVLGLSTAGGQASLKTLVDEPDFALAMFLLSVLGEGTFLALLWFLHRNAPDPVTREVTKLAAQDEARHVAFGLAHLSRHAELDKTLHARLALAVEQRHEALMQTAGLNSEVFDALVLLAAGEFSPEAIERGYQAVMTLQQEMDVGRRKRLAKLGFDDAEAERLSALHTRNFM